MSNNLLPLLTSLPLIHPSLLDLITDLQPFKSSQSNSLSKFLNRINTSILARELPILERHAALDIAKVAIEQDGWGHILGTFGKGWINASLGQLSATSVSQGSVIPYLDLLEGIILKSPSYPSFERENVLPQMGKVSTTLVKLLERQIEAQSSLVEYNFIVRILQNTRSLLIHSPAHFRPTMSTIRPLLLSLILTNSPLGEISDVREAAVKLLTTLYVVNGKSQIAQQWRVEMNDALGGLEGCLGAIVADGWDIPAAPGGKIPAGFPFLPEDMSRLKPALFALEGYSEIIISLLKTPTSRPIPIPIGKIVALAIRHLKFNLLTPVVSYISPQHHAELLTALPRFCTIGMTLLAQLASTCGDHLLVHMTDILDSVFQLIDNLPSTFRQQHIQLIHFFRLLLELFPAATWNSHHSNQLLKHCISLLAPLHESQKSEDAHSSSSHVDGNQTNTGSTGKRGKKRQRGEEDSLVAGLEGRNEVRIGVGAELALEALKLIPLLHPAPLLDPALLTLSIRSLISLYFTIPQLPSKSFLDPSIRSRLIEELKDVLEAAVLINEESGQHKGWKSVIISILDDPQGKFSTVLHPQVPPLLRPQPPLNQLHFFSSESEAEVELRKQLGLHASIKSSTDDEDDTMQDTEDPEKPGRTEGGEGGEVLVVPIAQNDTRAGRHPLTNQDLQGSTHIHVLDPKSPQYGHHPPNIDILSKDPPAARTGSGIVLKENESIMRIINQPEDTSSENRPIIIDPGVNQSMTDPMVGQITGDPVPHTDIPSIGPQPGQLSTTSGDDGSKNNPGPTLVIKDFGATSSSSAKGKGKEVNVNVEEDEDEGIPELDSGSSDFGSDDEDEEEDQDEL